MRNVSHQQKTRKGESSISSVEGVTSRGDRGSSIEPVALEETYDPDDNGPGGEGTHLNYGTCSIRSLNHWLKGVYLLAIRSAYRL